MKIQSIPIEQIKPSIYTLNEPDEEFASGLLQFIKTHGLKKPIIVRELKNSFRVMDGNAVLEVCKTLGYKEIDCVIHQVSDKEEYLLNEGFRTNQREADPIKQGQLYKKMVTEVYDGQVLALSLKLGRSQLFIKQRISIYEGLIDGLKQALREKKITVHQGFTYSKQPQDLQQEHLDALNADKQKFMPHVHHEFTGQICPTCKRPIRKIITA